MRASDLMTTEIIHIQDDGTVKQAVDLMLAHRVSGLPVLDAQKRMIGIVSEGDLIRRTELGTERQRGRLSRFFTDAQILAEEYVRSHATKVADIMTMAVVTAKPDTPLADIADLMDEHKIRRIPIVERTSLVGIVARRDLVRALAGSSPSLLAGAMMDRMIHDTITGELARQPWAAGANFVVAVRKGTVRMTGIVPSEAERKAAVLLAQGVPGVEDVENRIAVMPGELLPI